MKRAGKVLAVSALLFSQWFVGVMYGITEGKGDWVSHGALVCFLVSAVAILVTSWALVEYTAD